MRWLVFLALGAALSAPVSAQQSRIYSTTGDFDGDGERDVASYVVLPGKHTRISVRLSSQPEDVVVEETDGRHYGDYFTTVPPRTYKPNGACKSDVKALVVKHDAISYGSSEASETIIYWTGKTFEQVCMGD